MKTNYFLGVDFGTSVVKGSIIDDMGNIINQASYFRTTNTLEQSETWWADFKKLIKNLVTSEAIANKISAICVSSMAPNIFLTDIEGNNLFREVLYFENVAYDIELELDKKLNTLKWQNEVLSKLIWIKKNIPSKWKSLDKIFSTHNFINYKLTDNYCLDYLTAQETGVLFDKQTNQWNYSLSSEFEIPFNKFPEIKLPIDVVGSITKKASDETGLPIGILVLNGTTDSICSILSTGMTEKNDLLIYYGTYNCAALLNDNLIESLTSFKTKQPVEWIASIPRAGQQLSSLATIFFPDKDKYSSLRKFDDSAIHSVQGANGLIFYQVPFLLSTTVSTEPNGGFINLKPQHNINDISRSVIEAFGYGLKLFIESSGTCLTFNKVYAGGGGAKSSLWRQVITDILNLNQIYSSISDRALGTALVGMLALDIESFHKSLKNINKQSQLTEISTSFSDSYQENYTTYNKFMNGVYFNK